MKLLLQRVISAKVTINKTVVGEIEKGYVLLLGVAEGDSINEADTLAEKVVNLRVMGDKNDKMNLSVKDVNGEILVISQFTLCADTGGGRRPSFISAAKPETAKMLYLYFIEKLNDLGIRKVATGEFGEYMQVELINDGPVTIILDTEIINQKSEIK